MYPSSPILRIVSSIEKCVYALLLKASFLGLWLVSTNDFVGIQTASLVSLGTTEKARAIDRITPSDVNSH